MTLNEALPILAITWGGLTIFSFVTLSTGKDAQFKGELQKLYTC